MGENIEFDILTMRAEKRSTMVAKTITGPMVGMDGSHVVTAAVIIALAHFLTHRNEGVTLEAALIEVTESLRDLVTDMERNQAALDAAPRSGG